MATERELREYLRRAAADLTDSRRRVHELENAQSEPIAVVGMSCRFPGGSDSPDRYWQMLDEGRTGFGQIPSSRWDSAAYYDDRRGVPGRIYTQVGAFLDDVAGWDANFFDMPPAEALRTDPHQRLLMELGWECFDDTGVPVESVAKSKVGVLVGLMDTQQYGRLQYEVDGAEVAGDPYFGQGATANVAAGRLSYHFDLRGPAMTVDTACSSSLVAVHLAMQALRGGECDLALAGGVYLILEPDTYVQACATQQLSPTGQCRTFDGGADGYVMGEGGGMVMLERLSDAQRNNRRIHAVLRGSAVNQDGKSNGLTAPNRGAQVAVIQAALDDARACADEVAYVETHGSATHLGDAIEISALQDVFGGREAPLHLGAVKANIGHTQSAAGIAGLIKAVLALEQGALPPCVGLDEPSDALANGSVIHPVRQSVSLPGDDRTLMGVSGFGWSGTNAHVVLEAAPHAQETTPDTDPSDTVLVPITAATGDALAAQAQSYAAWLESSESASAHDAARMLARGRTHHDHRRAIVTAGRDELVAGLNECGDGHRTHVRPAVALLFAGIGDQYAALGRELYDSDPEYAEIVDDCLERLRTNCDVDLRRDLFDAATEGDTSSAQTLADDAHLEADGPEHSHPALFVIEYALAAWLTTRGVRVDAVVGYSLGEYVAGCIAGVFDLDDALRVVVERAKLIARVPAGGMVAVAGDESSTRTAIAESGAQVDIAALNGPSMTVVSGAQHEVDGLAEHLREKRIAHQKVRSGIAFHSRLLAPVRDALQEVLDTVTLHAPRVPLYGNATGGRLSNEQATSSAYWADHLVEPVRFASCIEQCLGDGLDVFVDVGPGQALGGVIHRDFATADVCVIPTLASRQQLVAGGPTERTRMLQCLGRLWECGATVDWTRIYPGDAPPISAPSYAFQRTRFWPDGKRATVSFGANGAMSTGVDDTRSGIAYVPDWRRDTAPARKAYELDGHLLIVGGPDTSDLAAAVAAGHGDADRSATCAVVGRGVDGLPEIETFDPTDLAHLCCLLDEVPVGQPVTLVYLADSADAATSQRSGGSAVADYLRLRTAGRALGARGDDSRLLTVSRGSLDIVGGDVVNPAAMGAHGFGRVAEREYPRLAWRGVDIDPSTADLGEAGAQIRREAAAISTADENSDVVAWRAGRRWLHRWTETTDDPETTGSPWLADGVYAITGGTGGLGRALAQHLVDHGVRRIALLSRHAEASAVADGLDAEVALIDADTADPESVRRAFRRCREHFGTLTGIIHAAGQPASGMIERQSPDSASSVVATKVNALGPIAEQLQCDDSDSLRQVVLYSSAATTVGPIGEADYCAANSVIDSFAQMMSNRHPQATVTSVGWGPWQHDTWQSADTSDDNALAGGAARYRERYGFTDDEGTDLLDRILTGGAPHVIAVRHSLDAAAAEWSSMLDVDELVAASRSTAGIRHPRPDLRETYVPPRSSDEERLAGIWQRYLGMEQVGVNDAFFDLGGNSLVGMAMMLELERELEQQIPPAVLFEHPTVAALAQALDELVQPGTTQASEFVDASVDRGRRRRKARNARRENVA